MRKIELTLLAILLISPVLALSNQTCQDLYFLVLKTNYNFTDYDLIQINSTRGDVYNFPSLCNDSAYKTLPEGNLPVLEIEKKIKMDCPYILQSGIWRSINLFNTRLKDPSCGDIKFLKYFFQIDKNESYYLTGLRVLPWGLSLLIVLGLIILISEKINGKSS